MTESKNVKLDSDSTVLKEEDTPPPELKTDGVSEVDSHAVALTKDAQIAESVVSENKIVTDSTKSVETQTDAVEIILPYRPYASTEKWIEHRFSAWSAPKTWFATILMVTFFAFGGPGHVTNWILEKGGKHAAPNFDEFRYE